MARPVFALAFAFAVAISSLACSTFQTTDDYDPGIDFSRFHSYAWQPHSLELSDPMIDTDLLRVRVQRAVDAELERKGLVPGAEGATPDLLVDYHVSTREKVDLVTFPSTWGYGPGWYWGIGTEVQAREYTQGTLVLDFVDGATKQLVWRGTASAEITRSRTPEERAKRIDDAVREILAPFPPGAAAER
jgi:hypothetical protein